MDFEGGRKSRSIKRVSRGKRVVRRRTSRKGRKSIRRHRGGASDEVKTNNRKLLGSITLDKLVNEPDTIEFKDLINTCIAVLNTAVDRVSQEYSPDTANLDSYIGQMIAHMSQMAHLKRMHESFDTAMSLHDKIFQLTQFFNMVKDNASSPLNSPAFRHKLIVLLHKYLSIDEKFRWAHANPLNKLQALKSVMNF